MVMVVLDSECALKQGMDAISSHRDAGPAYAIPIDAPLQPGGPFEHLVVESGNGLVPHDLAVGAQVAHHGPVGDDIVVRLQAEAHPSPGEVEGDVEGRQSGDAVARSKNGGIVGDVDGGQRMAGRGAGGSEGESESEGGDSDEAAQRNQNQHDGRRRESRRARDGTRIRRWTWRWPWTWTWTCRRSASRVAGRTRNGAVT